MLDSGHARDLRRTPFLPRDAIGPPAARMSDSELPLAGGLVDRVVRVGDTVRRPAGPWTEAVQALLGHLARRGFPAPRPLGLDEQGRERVSWVEGRPALWPWPAPLLREDGVREVGRLLRRFHDTVADFRPPGTLRWQRGDRAVLPGEIVCHGDLDASNVLWADDRPVALVDWESAYPGWPVTDLAQAASSLCPLAGDERLEAMGFRAPPPRRARLAALLDGYGAALEPLTVLTEAHRLQLERERIVEDWGAAGLEPWRTYREKGLGERSRAARRWLEDHLAELTAPAPDPVTPQEPPR